jgi:hypothetical protein
MIDLRFVPIQQWPGVTSPAKKRKRAPFKSSYAATLKLIERELVHLKAHNTLIQAYFDHEAIRADGWPKGGRAPSAPGIILTFQSGSASVMSFPCDTYSHWEDNLRAIGLALAALRAIRRYGVGKTTEQYRGFVALPPASPIPRRDAAIGFLSRVTGLAISEVERDLQSAYRTAARRLHPDSGGSHDQFTELQRHWEEL